MTFALILLAALALPYAVWRMLLRSRIARFALPLTTCFVGVAAILLQLWLMSEYTLVLSQAGADGNAHLTTYYIRKNWPFLWNYGLIYLGVALSIALTQKLGGNPIARFLPPVVGLFHLGSAIMVAQSVSSPFPVPRRYLEYAEAYSRLHQLISITALVTFISLTALALLTLAALIRGASRRLNQQEP